jgi:hypothetical protein
MSGRLVFGREHLVRLASRATQPGPTPGGDLRHGGGQFGQVLVHQGEGLPDGSARSVTASRVSNDGPCLRCGPMNPQRKTRRWSGASSSSLLSKPPTTVPESAFHVRQ